MAWNTVQKLVEGSGEHSSLIGKFWVTLFFVIRFLLIISIAKNSWSGAQSDFVCNTESPGCHQVCFNAFNPITPIGYWSFQLLAVAISSIVFNIYTVHKLALVSKALGNKKKFKEEQRKKKKEVKQMLRKAEGIEEDEKEEDEKEEEKEEKPEKKDDKKDEVKATKLSSEYPSKLYLAYFAMVVFRLFIEIGFMVGQYYLYSFKFVIPELFQCHHWPCPNVVDCFISQPKEKTIMLCAFFATGCIMVVLNIMELIQLSGKVSQAWSVRGKDVTKEVFGDEMAPQFDMPRGMHSVGMGGDGIYVAGPSGYPDATGIPMLYRHEVARRPKRSRFSRK